MKKMLFLVLLITLFSVSCTDPLKPNPGYAGNTLLILQFGAATDGNINRSFVELYNNGASPVNLLGHSLQWAAGFSTNSGNGAPDGNQSTDGPWNKIDLSGTIQPHHSFLILGPAKTPEAGLSPALTFAEDFGDMNIPAFELNNRALKIALMSNTTLLTVQNPYNTDGAWAKASGYVDMAGAINTSGTDYIQGYETNPISNLNKQAGQRRISITDSDNNAKDFARAVFAGALAADFEKLRPKNGAYGPWDPMTGEKDIPPIQGETVIVSGTYTLNFNSTHSQQKVEIEIYSDQAGTAIINRSEAIIANNSSGTWSMQAPKGQGIWFKVAVTDSTSYKFGKVVSSSAHTFNADASNVNLTLGPFALPEITAFELINADVTESSLKQNKTGSINQSSGLITFADTCITTLDINNIIDFHKLAANFTVTADCKLYTGTGSNFTEQVSGVTTNNYFQPVTLTVVSGDNVRKTYTIAGQVLDVNSNANGASNETAVNRVVGTSSWQTQGYGIMILDTVDKTVGLPPQITSKLNAGIWNDTGTYTYIGPTGRVLTGGTSIRATGNWSYRTDIYKSYNLKLNNAAGFDYYDYNTQVYRTLPAHRRWRLLAHEVDSTRLKNALGMEMGRRVLTNMGWQPHNDWVFVFLNGQYMGLYILSEVIKPELGRLGISPLISTSNPNGGFIVETKNYYYYVDERTHIPWLDLPVNAYTFSEMYNFMSSHHNPHFNRQQGTVWTMKEPDSDLGWYEPEPPMGDGASLTWGAAHAGYFPRKAISLMAILDTRGSSKPPAEWRVPNDVGTPNSPGTSGFLLNGSFSTGDFTSNGGIAGSRTLGNMYPGWQTSTFVRISQILQDAEDAVYSHDWLTKGYGQGTYLDRIDINSLIDFHIAGEISSDFELINMNGRYVHYDPAIGKLKMGPLWDTERGWDADTYGMMPGFLSRISFWYKELLGWEITQGDSSSNLPNGREKTPRNHDPYYVDQLKARWNTVKGQFEIELYPYIDAQIKRFDRVTGFNKIGSPFSINGNRAALKNHITPMLNNLDMVINEY